MEEVVLEDTVKDKGGGKMGRDWNTGMGMVVGNKATVGPSYRTESAGR